MLYFVGLGLKLKHLTKEGEFALRNSEKIYVEAYTSKYAENSLEDLEKYINKEIIKVYREDVELNFKKIIEEAENNIVSFCVFGNITSATTHSSLIKEAIEKDIPFKLIPGISIFSVIPMLTGLQEYRFGKTISIVKPLPNYKPKSFFKGILENKEKGLHTLCLLDIKIEKDKEYFMQPYEAAERLLDIAKEEKVNAEDWECVVVAGATSENQIIFKTTLKKLKNFITDFDFPSSLVIIGKKQMDEEDFLKVLDSY